MLNWDVSDEGFIPCLPEYRRFTSNLTLYIVLLWDLRIAWLFCFCVNDEFRYGQRLIYSRCAYSYLTRCADNGCIVITRGPLWLKKARDAFRWFRWLWSGCVYVQLSKMPWYGAGTGAADYQPAVVDGVTAVYRGQTFHLLYVKAYVSREWRAGTPGLERILAANDSSEINREKWGFVSIESSVAVWKLVVMSAPCWWLHKLLHVKGAVCQVGIGTTAINKS